MKVLHLGCGRVGHAIKIDGMTECVTLDADPLLRPDLVCKLGAAPIAMPDNSVDLAIAIHVLEHIGIQGDTMEWFAFWEELYRVLKPDGKIQFESPLYSSVWAWSDPSHTRALSPLSFVFFSQDSYRIKTSGISPYRVKCDFTPLRFEFLKDGDPKTQAIDNGRSHFRGVLQAKKPFRGWWEDQ